MVCGGVRKDNRISINSKNVFAALGSLKKKKKSKGVSKKGKKEDKVDNEHVFWDPTPLTVRSWADVDDEDYYAITLRLRFGVWALGMMIRLLWLRFKLHEELCLQKRKGYMGVTFLDKGLKGTRSDVNSKASNYVSSGIGLTKGSELSENDLKNNRRVKRKSQAIDGDMITKERGNWRHLKEELIRLYVPSCQTTAT
uniref:Uncharacterized protein n=1 Tax=Tanacetum cinerariifolium TaxID=118510 RepID=A0A6L2N904_TANCI|nr:hypothetical protein [Tanacetum cinerariifolium]GEV73725.1 hypothetical protein [Tanacetum cinerariifolium]